VSVPAPERVAAPVSELGTSRTTGRFWDLEETPEIRWPESVRVYDRMRQQDAQVTSVLRAVTMPVRRTTWRLDPNGAPDEVTALVAEDLRLPIVGQTEPPPTLRLRDRFSWTEHLQLALLMVVYGHMFFEQVYRLDANGYARLRKLAPRLPRSIVKINVADDGGLQSIEQAAPPSLQTPTGRVSLTGLGRVTIPVERLVAYVHEREGGDWTGRSLLRPAYKDWLLKDRLLRVQTTSIDRNGMGLPIYEAAEKETDPTAGMKLATEARSGESAGAWTPFGAKLRLAGVEGDLPDADKAIRYHDEQIARAVLAHFLNLGTQTGSWALGSTFADFFSQSLQALAQQVADTASQHVVEDLVDVNFGPDVPAPRIVFDEIGTRHAATAEAIKALIDAGAIFPDRSLEEALRQVYGLPGKDSPPPTTTSTTEDA